MILSRPTPERALPATRERVLNGALAFLRQRFDHHELGVIVRRPEEICQ